MRTVAFSDRKVAELANRDFVPVWKNIRPETRFRDGIYAGVKGDRTVLALGPGDGATNICALVVTPGGLIVHAIQGYLEKEPFLRELEFGLKAARVASEDNASGRLRALYAERRRETNPKNEGELLRERNLRFLERTPLPALDGVLRNSRAGLSDR